MPEVSLKRKYATAPSLKTVEAYVVAAPLVNVTGALVPGEPGPKLLIAATWKLYATPVGKPVRVALVAVAATTIAFCAWVPLYAVTR